MNIQLTLAFRYLSGRKLRTFLTTLAVVFGVMIIFGMNILLPTMIQSFQANILAASGQVDMTITHKTGEAFSPSVAAAVAGIDGVRAVTGFLNRAVNLPADYFDRDPAKADRVATLSLAGLDPETAQTLHSYPVAQGRFLLPDDRPAAVITTSLAEALGLKPGDDLPLPAAQGTVRLKIVGLLPARTLPGNEEVLVTLPEAQVVFDQPDQINTVEANFNTTDSAQRAAIESAIESALGENYHFGALPTGSELLANLRAGQAAVNLFGFMALFMGAFIIFNTFRTVVAERRRDLAMLRIVGASRRAVTGIILVECLLQGVIGTFIGIVLGYVIGAGLIGAMSPLMQQYIHLKLGAPVVTPTLLIVTVALGVGITVLAGLLPALSASRVTPMEALRPALGESIHRAARRSAIVGGILLALALAALFSRNAGLIGLGAVLLLTGLILLAPALVRPIAVGFGALAALAFARQGTATLAEGNVTRQPSRAAVTASATMIGLAIIVALGGMTTSISGWGLNLVKKSLGSDYLFIPPAVGVWANNVGAASQGGLADRLRAVDGVGLVSTMRFGGAAINGTPISLLGIDPQVFPQVSGLNFASGDPDTAYADLASSRALIINGPFAANTGLKAGDTVTVAAPDGDRTYRIAAVAGDYFNAKISTGYLSQANLQTDFHKTDDVFIQLNLAPGADAAAVEPEIKAVAADYPQFSLVSGKAYYDQNKKLFDVAFVVFDVLMGVLALPSLIAMLNTLAIGVIERTREIGMLRAVGATRPQVRRIVLLEALMLAAIGTALGLLAGLYLGYVFVVGLNAAGFAFPYSFPLTGLVVGVAAGLLFGVLAALLPARQAAQMEIVKALRYE